MTIEGARRVLAGEAMPELAEALRSSAPDDDARRLLADALKELAEIRALLTNNPSKENRS